MRTKMMPFAVGSQYQAVNELNELQDVYGLFTYDFCVGYISCRYYPCCELRISQDYPDWIHLDIMNVWIQIEYTIW